MLISEIILFLLLLVAATIMEMKFLEMHPIIWLVGSVIALVYGITGSGFVSWKESVICFVIVLAVMVLFYSRVSALMGGGILKSFCMCAMFLGRYVFITILLAVIIMKIVSILVQTLKKNSYSGGNMVCGMPIVMIASIITMGILYKFVG